MTGYKKPPSIEKSRSVLAAFEEKVSLLELWGVNGLPDNILLRAKPDGSFDPEDVPLDNAKLRRWRGPDRNLLTWSDPLIDRHKTGKNPELAERFLRAAENIKIWLNAKKGRPWEMQIGSLTSENERLRVQNAFLLGEIQELKDQVRALSARVAPRR